MTGDDDCLVLALPLIGQEIPSFPPSIVAKLEMGMSDENENRSGQANRMDEAFCARMRAAIEAGLERRRLVSSPRRELTIQNTSQQSIPVA